jgi:DNA mismatch repair protein MutS
LERLENFQAAVKEFGDKIVFLRTIIPGISDKSYGIHVAQMAGLPSEVIERAKEILNFHISQENIHETRQPIPASNQLSIFEQKENELKKAIAALDLDKMTPIQALQTLDKLKKEHGL